MAALRSFCVAWASLWSGFAALAGFLLAWGFLWLSGQAYVAAQPVAVRIQAVTVHESPPGAIERSLRVQMESPPAGNCTRTSQHLLRQDATYFPLGSALNGLGFSGSHWRFTLVFSLPTGMQPGQYEYIQRSAYVCSWLAGFVQRRITYQSEPVIVTIAAGGTSTSSD